ncbi:maturation protein [ssRNA phage AIN000]|uniref:Maturation protein n=1 Tax=ssRNA phage AIN000 TaxID=2785983 RepID=A0A8S5KX71_9VIRU|nr:maturation protein [ssRNA phage AIN000]DAD49838.1 TPA_asm: maturation protein [ssRNA phage AIN000]
MSKRQQSMGSVFVGLRNSTSIGTVTGYSSVPKTTGPPSVNSKVYTNQMFSSHKASFSHGDLRRPVMNYTVHAIRVIRGEYNYKASAHPLATTYFGTTDTSRGLGPTSYATFGLKQAGDFWVPDFGDSLVTQAVSEAKMRLSGDQLNVGTSIAEGLQTLKMASAIVTSLAGLMARMASTGLKYAGYPAKARISRTQLRDMHDRYVSSRYVSNLGSLRTGYLHTRSRGSRDLARLERNFFEHMTGRRRSPFVSPRSGWRRNQTLDGGLSFAEQAWLQLQYGMFPFIQDIYGLIQLAAAQLQKEDAVVSVNRTITKRRDLPTREIGYPYFKAEGVSKYGAQCQLTYRVSNPSLFQLASIGLTNPFSVGWEVTPYSFVFDWLIPIGNVLAAFSAGQGLAFSSGFTNRRSHTNFRIETCLHGGAIGVKPNVTFQNSSQVRTAITVDPLPGLYYKNPLSNSHAVSAYALLGQAMRR